MASKIVVRDVDAGYGAVRVLHGVSIEVREGETVALLGTNGNGKSTLIRCIMGMLRPDAGEIYLESDGGRIDLARKSTEDIVDLGIALVPEGRRLFPRLTVEENLRLAVQARDPGRFDLWRRAEDLERVDAETRALVDFLGLSGLEAAQVDQLSYGGQRLMEIGVARGVLHELLVEAADGFVDLAAAFYDVRKLDTELAFEGFADAGERGSPRRRIERASGVAVARVWIAVPAREPRRRDLAPADHEGLLAQGQLVAQRANVALDPPSSRWEVVGDEERPHSNALAIPMR